MTTPFAGYGGYAQSSSFKPVGWSGKCSGQIQGTLTWPQGATLPAAVVVEEQCTASWGSDGAPIDTGACDCGLPGATITSNNYGATSAGVRYTAYPTAGGGSPLSSPLTLSNPPSPSASVTVINKNNGGGSDVSASVDYAVSVFPVTINLGGTVPDANGTPHILIGQGCTPHLNGIPSGCTITKYTWSITGVTGTFQNYQIAENLTAKTQTSSTTYASGAGPLNIANPHWYWSDKAGTATVKCSATVQPPANQGNSFNVTVQQNVVVEEPVATTLAATPGRVQINQQDPKQSQYKLYAGTDAVHGVYRGFDLSVVLNTPSPTTSPPSLVDFTTKGAGAWNVIQIVTPGRWRTPNGGTEVAWRDNALGAGLDTNYPYDVSPKVGTSPSPLTDLSPGSTPADGAYADTGDSPGFLLDDSYSNYRVAEKFTTTVMYLPPGTDVHWVPFKQVAWSWNTPGTGVTKPGTSWLSWQDSNTNTSAGSVATPVITRLTVPPQWKQVITVPATPDGW